MDYSFLKGNVTEIDTKRMFGGNWQKGVVKLLRNKDYNNYLVFAQSKDLSTWLFAMMARLLYPQKRVYFWSHGFYGKESHIESAIKKELFKLPNGGTFLYGDFARELMIKEGLDSSKLFVIHNSLAYDEQVAIRQQLIPESIYQDHFGNKNPNLFFVGRLTPVKKLDMILFAMRLLNERDEHYNMTFIGGGEEKVRLEALTRQLGLEDHVWYYGPCYDEMVLGKMIYNADLCVSPGNVGLTAMHTMVFGTPIISHNDFTHQMPEFEAIHEGKTGLFFEYGNVESLADKISLWFSENAGDRSDVRIACMEEIDNNWTPQFQLEVLKKHLL